MCQSAWSPGLLSEASTLDVMSSLVFTSCSSIPSSKAHRALPELVLKAGPGAQVLLPGSGSQCSGTSVVMDTQNALCSLSVRR